MLSMLTRSMTRELKVEIDFDEASRAWRENKIVLKNGCFEYKPEAVKYYLRTKKNKIEYK